MQGRTKTLLACLAGLLLTVAMPLVQAQADKNTKAGFEKLRSLVGEWQATLPDGKLMRVSYAEINGGAIEERYRSKDPMWWNMSTVYHLDKNRIMMTHYCSWGNHPRMTAIVPDLPEKRLHARRQLRFRGRQSYESSLDLARKGRRQAADADTGAPARRFFTLTKDVIV